MTEYKQPKIQVPRFSEEAGFYTTPERSKMMSKIRGKNTKAELQLRRALWAAGVRYRVNVKTLPGRPDIASKKLKFVVFVDGGFWHGYQWADRKTKLKANKDFWIPKIERNMQRDAENNARLQAMGYTVYRFWQDEVRKGLMGCILQILSHIEHCERYS